MKRLILVGFMVMVAMNVYAAPIKVTVTDTDTNTVLQEVVLSAEEVKAVEYYVTDFAVWIANAVSNKANARLEAFVNDNSDKQGSKVTKTAAKKIAKDANVKSRKERDNE